MPMFSSFGQAFTEDKNKKLQIGFFLSIVFEICLYENKVFINMFICMKICANLNLLLCKKVGDMTPSPCGVGPVERIYPVLISIKTDL